MTHMIKEAVGSIVAADVQSSIAALDNAVVMQSRLCASVIEAAGESRLPVVATQKLLEAMSAGIRGLTMSRNDMVETVRELTRIKADSNLDAADFGCPGGLETFTDMARVSTSEIVRAA